MKTAARLCVVVCSVFLLTYGHMASSIWEKVYKLASSPLLSVLILRPFGFHNRALVCHNDQNACDSSFKRSILHLAISCGQEAHSNGN